jgi:hypothetical protein
MIRVSMPHVRMVALFVAVLAMLAAMISFPSAASAQTTGAIDVDGKVFNKNGKLRGTFEGTVSNLTVTHVPGKGLRISGLLEGTLTRTDGTTEQVSEQFTTKFKLSQQQQSCQILELDIGPIHLDLLGLVVDLSAIHLDVTAVPGEGNLLGNLLCALVGLLDDLSKPDLADFLNGLLQALFPPAAP